MKKLGTIVTAFAMLFATSSFAAGPETVTPKVKAVFEKDFAGAKHVNWEKSDDFYFASFKMGAVNVDAAYNEQGELLGTSRRIETSQLPLAVSVAVANKYQGFNVANQVLELTFEGQTSYYITVQLDRQVLQLKAEMSGDISVEKRSKI